MPGAARAAVLGLGLAGTLVPAGIGCATSLSSRASRVRYAQPDEVRGCRFITRVQGTSGWGGTQACETGSNNARNDALEDAAAAGATHVVWTNVGCDAGGVVAEAEAYVCAEGGGSQRTAASGDQPPGGASGSQPPSVFGSENQPERESFPAAGSGGAVGGPSRPGTEDLERAPYAFLGQLVTEYGGGCDPQYSMTFGNITDFGPNHPGCVRRVLPEEHYTRWAISCPNEVAGITFTGVWLLRIATESLPGRDGTPLHEASLTWADGDHGNQPTFGCSYVGYVIRREHLRD